MTTPLQYRPPLVALVALGLLLSGCSKPEEPEVIAAERPVKSILVGGAESGGERKFPGRIDSSSKAELSFRIPGTITEMRVREGDLVEQGQALVELDPTDYEIVLKDRQATFDRNRKDFERAQELVKDGFISRTDFDTKESEFKSAEAALDAAKQDLKYTKLTAPFGGAVAQRYAEKAEEIQAKQPVLAIQDEQQLEVKIDMPEAIVSRIERSDERDRTPIWATFDSAPDRRIDLRFKEVSTRADAATQTFEATFLMEPPEGLSILPGMTATVTADMAGVVGAEERHFLPVSAVTADAGLEPFVWVIDESDMTVTKTPVQVGRMSGWNIEVEVGVEPGMRLVTAGVGYLAEGMKVRLMEQPEQAQPRPEEAPNPIVPELEAEIEKLQGPVPQAPAQAPVAAPSQS